jgi:hypothetical protein
MLPNRVLWITAAVAAENGGSGIGWLVENRCITGVEPVENYTNVITACSGCSLSKSLHVVLKDQFSTSAEPIHLI